MIQTFHLFPVLSPRACEEISSEERRSEEGKKKGGRRKKEWREERGKGRGRGRGQVMEKQ
jgi:hypothetical protein